MRIRRKSDALTILCLCIEAMFLCFAIQACAVITGPVAALVLGGTVAASTALLVWKGP